MVRAALEQIGGRALLESKLGVGTTVRLDLPMTVAMSRIMVVETGGQLFGISMDAVSETVRVTPDRISRIKGNIGFVSPRSGGADHFPGRAHEPTGRDQAGRHFEAFGRPGSCREDSGQLRRRDPRPPRRGSQADGRAARRCPRLCRNDIAGKRGSSPGTRYEEILP